ADFRVLRMELSEQRRDPGDADGVGHGEPQPASRATLQLTYRAFGFLQLLGDALAMFEIHVAGLGEAEAARGPVQELRAEPRFQLLDLAADGGLGQAERPGRGDEAALFDHLDEDEGVVEVVSHGEDSGEGDGSAGELDLL